MSQVRLRRLDKRAAPTLLRPLAALRLVTRATGRRFRHLHLSGLPRVPTRHCTRRVPFCHKPRCWVTGVSIQTVDRQITRRTSSRIFLARRLPLERRATMRCDSTGVEATSAGICLRQSATYRSLDSHFMMFSHYSGQCAAQTRCLRQRVTIGQQPYRRHPPPLQSTLAITPMLLRRPCSFGTDPAKCLHLWEFPTS
jgi:hypothetical protein